MPVSTLMVDAGWRGLSGALAKMVSPVSASRIIALFEVICLLMPVRRIFFLSLVFFVVFLVVMVVLVVVVQEIFVTLSFTDEIFPLFPRTTGAPEEVSGEEVALLTVLSLVGEESCGSVLACGAFLAVLLKTGSVACACR